MISLFDKKEKSPLFQITFIFFLVILSVLNNNEKIIGVPYAYISFMLIQIIFSIYVLFKGVFLIKGTFEELPKRKRQEKIQVLFIILFLILLLFVTIKGITHIISYIRLM